LSSFIDLTYACSEVVRKTDRWTDECTDKVIYKGMERQLDRQINKGTDGEGVDR
jgi:hypothetical protein